MDKDYSEGNFDVEDGHDIIRYLMESEWDFDETLATRLVTSEAGSKIVAEGIRFRSHVSYIGDRLAEGDTGR